MTLAGPFYLPRSVNSPIVVGIVPSIRFPEIAKSPIDVCACEHPTGLNKCSTVKTVQNNRRKLSGRYHRTGRIEMPCHEWQGQLS